METWSIDFNAQPNSCTLCKNLTDAGEGLILKLCSHFLCISCLRQAVHKFGGSVVSCPASGCQAFLLVGEVKTVSTWSQGQNMIPRLSAASASPVNTTTAFSKPKDVRILRPPHFGESSRSVRLYDDEMEITNIYFTTEVSRCEFCSIKLAPGAGIRLQMCLHVFCKDCLRGSIAASSGGSVTCPADSCDECLLDREIKALLSREDFEDYIRKGLLAAGADIPMFQCKTRGCSGLCLLESGGPKVFLCYVCNQQNCLDCKVIHDAIPCEKWRQLRAQALPTVTDEEILLQAEDFGYSQLAKTVNSMLKGLPKGDLAGYYEAAGQLLEAMPVVPTADDFECMICTGMASETPEGGVILQQCHHAFCWECLRNTIKVAEELPVPCPYVDPSTGDRCKEVLSSAEFKALAPPDVFEKHIRWGWSVAEDVIQNKVRCLSPGCHGFWEISGGPAAGVYTCPVCSKENCVNCKVIHSGQTCYDYQEQLRLAAERVKDEENRRVQAQKERASETEVNRMITTRQFMRCPHCAYVCEKISGCNSVTCLNRACRRPFTWQH